MGSEMCIRDRCNDDKWPTARQVFVGVWQFYSSHLDMKVTGGDRASFWGTIATYQRVFIELERLINFPDLARQFSWGGSDEYDLWNPTSKACFLVLFLYSIEPPLYFYLNDACRTKNKALLPMLGPFACAIWQVLAGAEYGREDKFMTGL